MTIKIYNTLSRQKEVFEPIQEGKVHFYVCGPTVYNYIHIGNARSAVAFDTIRRYLEYRNYEVTYISNFTDVDDKIIKAAKEEELTPQALSDKYIQTFFEDTQAINIKKATHHPRVMDNIQEIIQFIEDLIDKGFAYESQGDVYFRTEKFDNYGQLSNKTIDELRMGASERTSDDESQRKEHPVDFALWKANKDTQEIAWDSPWGPGRPGWHIECSVMSTKYLGQTIDIHGGGQDLEFPHHENEIAQSEARSGQHFANYWMHNGFVTIGEDDEKMSKSLGNFVLLRDLIRDIDPQVVRLLLSSVHYRRPLRYDARGLQEAKTNLDRMKEAHRRIQTMKQSAIVESSENIQETIDEIDTYEEAFQTAMDDDFNAANGLTVIFDFIKFINHYLLSSEVHQEILVKVESLLETFVAIFGIELSSLNDETLADEIQALINQRQQARKDKNFALADKIRDDLFVRGIQLDDTPQGTTWKKI